MVSQIVLDELKRQETQTGIYRTRVAAQVLNEWATKQQQW
jgi:hypothetical protein